MKITIHNKRFCRVEAERNLTILQISDVHYDATECDRALLTKHLKEAEKIGALVFCNGDWFDLMQGKKDPRGSYNSLRPEYKGIDYLDLVIQESAEFLSQFNLTYIFAQGNHETNITERMHHNPLSALCMLLKMKGREAHLLGYDGYIQYSFHQKGNSAGYLQYFHHGYGGAAPRSKGILNADLNQAAYPDADLYTTGHTHNKTYLPMIVERVDVRNFTIKEEQVIHLQTGSYKKLSSMGWAKEKGFKATPLGGWFVELSHHRTREKSYVNAKVYEA